MTSDAGTACEVLLVQETKRLLERYLLEIVLPLNLCPWAAPALAQGLVDTHVLPNRWEIPRDTDGIADIVRGALERTPKEIELVLLVFPRLSATRLDMDELLRAVRTGGDRTFALAAFHPDARNDTSSPERFIPSLRRSPDPLLQAVRQSRLDRLRGREEGGTMFLDIRRIADSSNDHRQRGDLRQQIAEQNLAAAQELGLDRLETLFQDIFKDHEQSRKRLQSDFRSQRDSRGSERA